MVSKGNIRRVKNKLDDAEFSLQKAIRLSKNDPIPYGGMAQLKLDQANKAITENMKQNALIYLDEANNYLSLGLKIEL